ncbi:carbonic anhydrase1 [Zea mays]|uniref:Carbonic anhydrase1 n=1 Tax=Zea mays TaxID=4577 RepID=A0A1D6NHR1_MAIZE|nr:carbonic anhydrase1 [Zea mays]
MYTLPVRATTSSIVASLATPAPSSSSGSGSGRPRPRLIRNAPVFAAPATVVAV